MKKIISMSLLSGVCLSAMSGIVYEENFCNYNTEARSINQDACYGLDNDPIWARSSSLKVEIPKDKKAAFLYKEALTLPKNNKFDFHFSYRMLNGTAPVEAKAATDKTPAVAGKPGVPVYFDLVFKTEKGKEQKVRIASDSVAGFPVQWTENWNWHGFAIKANGKKADIYFTHDRALRKVGTIDLIDDLATLNIFASPDKKFAITDIVLQTPGALPSFPASKHFASYKSLSQDIPGAVTAGAQGAVIDLTPSSSYSGIRFSLGSDKESTLEIEWEKTDDKQPVVDKYPVKVVPHWYTIQGAAGKYKKREKVTLPDAAIEVGRFFTQFVRPSLDMYSSSYDMELQGVDVIREWEALPKATKHPLDMEFVRLADGTVQLYVDGSYIKTVTRKDATLKRITLTLAQGAKYIVKKDNASYDKSRFMTFDFTEYPRAKAFADGKSSLKAGMNNFGGIPIDIASPIDSADIAICKQAKGNWALECDEYHGRSPHHGYPSAVHYRIPAAFYSRAHIVFALDPDPKKDAILTIRMGHYIGHGSGANMLGDTIIDLRDGKIPGNFKQIGTVKKGGKDIPLYLASVDLNLGPILDIANGRRYDGHSSGDYIDFEFIGKGWINFQQLDRRAKPDPDSDSAFNLFGVTLEKLPVKIDIDQNNHPGNVYTVNEKNRNTSFTVEATRAGAKGSVSWTICDVDGKELATGKKSYNLAKTGDIAKVDIPLGDKLGVGYYTAKVIFHDDATKGSFAHDATFAVMPPEKRMVNKWDSPYATWWFAAHGSPGTPEIGGPLLKKAGIVRVSANKMTEEQHNLYNTTDYRIVYFDPKMDWEKKDLADITLEEVDPNNPNGPKIKKTYKGREGAYIDLKRRLEANPKADTVMMWHESAPGYGIPEELLNMPYDPKIVSDRDKANAVKVNVMGEIVQRLRRELKRDFRFQIGNSSASVGSVVRTARAGAKVNLIESVGIETPSQVIPPERLSEVGLQGMRITQDIADYYAAKQKVQSSTLNGCWEFTYRADRDMGEKKQAEWYMRDVLISLANNFYYISPGIFFDCKNGYYNGLWGGSGIIRRSPFCYPKQAYVAYGVLTSVLDGVKYTRQIDTGSTTVYALEFARKDGKTVTALWAARGEATFALNGVKNGLATHMLGNTEKVANGDATIKGGTSPLYLVTDKPLAGVSIAGRAFAEDEALAARATVAWAIDNADEVTVEPDPEMESNHTSYLPILKKGDFTVATVTDEEKGACIEVTLDTSKDPYKSRYITEYTTIRFKEPKAIEGNPEVIGVWVKGNSNWGQIRFEIEDANGEVFKNLTTGRAWGCDVMDWPGNLAVSFDGWGYVYTTIVPTDLVPTHSPGPYSEQWVSEGGNKKIEFPIKVRAITVGMNRTKLNLTGYAPSVPSIRLKDVGGVK